MKINPIIMVNIAKAAMYWYIDHESEKVQFTDAKQKCFEIIRNFDFVKWDEDAELFIDEMPF